MTRSPATARPWKAPLLALALALALALGCDSENENPIREVSQQEVVSGLESKAGPLLLDVRTPQEFAQGHLPGALLVPVSEVPGRLAEVREASQGREVVVYCERGGRAMRAAESLIDGGFQGVGHLEGDMSAWRGAQLPVQY